MGEKERRRSNSIHMPHFIFQFPKVIFILFIVLVFDLTVFYSPLIAEGLNCNQIPSAMSRPLLYGAGGYPPPLDHIGGFVCADGAQGER
jgi:hypothetical protein